MRRDPEANHMKRSWAKPAFSLLVVLAACGPSKAHVDSETGTKESRLGGDAPGAAMASQIAAAVAEPRESAAVDAHRGSLDLGLTLPALPARAGFGPSIALGYATATHDGAHGFGVGFHVDVPSITMTTDWGVPYRGVVDDRGGDVTARLSLGGARLVWVRKEIIGDKARIEYRLDAGEDAIRVYRFPDGGTARAKSAEGADTTIAFKGFQVVHPDGRQDIYSEDPAIAEGQRLSADSFFATRWPLQYSVGPTGELVTYEYESADDARSYLRSVTFGGGRSKYVFETATRAKSFIAHHLGFPQGTKYVYTKISALLDGEAMNQWCLVHASFDAGGAKIVTHPDCQALADDDFAADRQTLAASLDEQDKIIGIYRFGRSPAPFAKSTPAEPLLRFRYTDIKGDDLGGHSLVYNYEVPGVYGFGPQGGSELLDVNADGLDDILRYAARDGASYPAYNQGDLESSDAFVRGAGVVLEKIVGGVRQRDVPHFDETLQSSSVFLLGDFDGDGRSDIVQASRDGARSRLALFRGQSAAKPFATATRDALVDIDLSRLLIGRGRVVDVNGDAKDDIVIATTGGSETTFTAYVNVTRPGEEALAFVALPALKLPFRAAPGVELDHPSYRFLDVNGDGLTDFATLKVGTAGDKGLCVYENRGGVTAYAGDRRVTLARGALLFGDAAARDSICGNGYFLSIAGLASNQNLNAIWLVDANRDGLTDLVDLGPTGRELHVWLGRGRSGFAGMRTIALNAGVAVDPNNKWNTRVVDTDGDGAAEILVYESTATGGRIKIIDFNRVGITNRVAPNLLTQTDEGAGLRQAFEYSTINDELIRDRRRLGFSDPRVAGIPLSSALVKRHFIAAGGGAPRVLDYQYHYPRYDEVDHDLLGFAEVDELAYGDATGESVVTRRAYELSAGGSPNDRFLAEKIRSVQSFAPALTATQQKRIDDSAAGWKEGIDAVSRTSETWREEELKARATLALHGERWTVIARDADPKRAAGFVRCEQTTDTRCDAGSACAAGATVTRTFAYDDATNLLTRERVERPRVAGPQGTEVPARSTQRTLTYDPTWAARGVLDAVSEETTIALPSERLLASTTVTFAADFPLPARVNVKVLVDADAIADLPEAVRAPIATESTRATEYRYDAFGNVVETSDGLGVVQRLAYDAASLRVVQTTNALGHTTTSCYGTADCALSALGATIPARSLAVTHAQSAQGELQIREYDERGRPTRTFDTTGAETLLSYREAGASSPLMVRASERRWSDAEAASRGEPAFVQHLTAVRADGLPVAQIDASEDGGARVQSHVVYNRRLQSIADAVPYRVDADLAQLFGRGEIAPLPAATCGTGIATCSSFDALGRPVRTTDPSGRITTTIAYDAWGERTDQSLDDPSGQTIRSRSTIGSGDQTDAIVDETGAVHRFERDERGALRRIRMAGETASRLTVHDSTGSLVLTRIPGGPTRVWGRDARGRVAEECTWDSALEGWERALTTYDPLDRTTRIATSSSKHPDGWDDVAFVYDVRGDGPAAPTERGRLLRATVSSIALEDRFTEDFTYDRGGQIIGRRAAYEGDGSHREYVEAWTFALDGMASSHTDPFGNVFAVQATPWRAPRAMDWTAPGHATAPLLGAIRYDAHGQLGGYVVEPSKVQRSIAYDAASGLLTHLDACAGGDADACSLHHLQNMAYTRWADGRVASFEEAAGTTSYAYSARGELREARSGDRLFSYAYGAAGQLATMSEGEARTFSPVDGASAMPLPSGGNHRVDGFGRLVAGGAIRSAEYDPRGRLRRVEVDGKAILYGYSATGERVSKRVHALSGQTETPAELVVYPSHTTRDDGAQRQSVVHVGSRRAAIVVDETRVLPLLDDELGITRAVLDESGQIVASVAYTPFGKVAPPAEDGGRSGLSSTELVFSFSGQLADPDTGFVHMGAREYVPELGSFSSPDPFMVATPEYCTSSPLECHLYTFVAHDPINSVDPTGFMAENPGRGGGRGGSRGGRGGGGGGGRGRGIAMPNTMEGGAAPGLGRGAVAAPPAAPAAPPPVAPLTAAERGFPHGFENAGAFNGFTQHLREGLDGAGFTDTRWMFQGSAVTGVSHAGNVPFGDHSDFDIALAGGHILERAVAERAPLRGRGTRALLGDRQVRRLGLRGMQRDLSAMAGRRDVNFMAFDSLDTAFGRHSVGYPPP
jgi:RHS repeat-associated protein